MQQFAGILGNPRPKKIAPSQCNARRVRLIARDQRIRLSTFGERCIVCVWHLWMNGTAGAIAEFYFLVFDLSLRLRPAPLAPTPRHGPNSRQDSTLKMAERKSCPSREPRESEQTPKGALLL